MAGSTSCVWLFGRCGEAAFWNQDWPQGWDSAQRGQSREREGVTPSHLSLHALPVPQTRRPQRRFRAQLALLHDLIAQLVAFFVDGGDDEAHGDAHFHQQRFGELQRGFEGLGDGEGGAGAVEPGGVGGIAGAGDDRQLWVLGAQLLDQPLRRLWLIHGEDGGAGTIEAKAGERCAARDIAERHGIAGALARGDQFGIGVYAEIGLVVSDQHVGDQPPHPAKADDDGVACGL